MAIHRRLMKNVNPRTVLQCEWEACRDQRRQAAEDAGRIPGPEASARFFFALERRKERERARLRKIEEGVDRHMDKCTQLFPNLK